MRILITGPQGSGKTTQAELLAKYLNIPLIDSGNMLRQLSLEPSAQGRKVNEALDSGVMVPDEIVADVVKNRLSQEDYSQGFVMDGYPRRLSQLKEFDPKFEKVFYLDLSDQAVKERLEKRGREDDTPELIEKRLRLYHELTEPVLEYYQNQGVLTRVNGLNSIEVIQDEIRKDLNG